MKITLSPFLSALTRFIHPTEFRHRPPSHKNHNIPPFTNNYTVHLTRQRRAPRSQEICKRNKSTSVSTGNARRPR